MKSTLLLTFLVFLLTISVSGQTIAQKLPIQQRQETLSDCGDAAFWLKGHWQWNEAQKAYQWIEGRCEPHRKGYTYIPGRWAKVADGWQWREGIWKKI